MLDLEVVPERSLGNEQWEFILGKFPLSTINKFPIKFQIQLKLTGLSIENIDYEDL